MNWVILASNYDKKHVTRWVIMKHKGHNYCRYVHPASWLEKMEWLHKYYEVVTFVNRKHNSQNSGSA